MSRAAPPPALRIEGTIARIPRYVPVRLMSITWRQAGYVRDHDVRALGDEAARVAGAHSTGPPP